MQKKEAIKINLLMYHQNHHHKSPTTLGHHIMNLIVIHCMDIAFIDCKIIIIISF